MNDCRECQRLRLELAAIDERLLKYRAVADHQNLNEGRREAMRACGWIESRLSTLKNEKRISDEPGTAERWGVGEYRAQPVAIDSDKAKRSSMRTLFEMRGRWWILFPLSWALLLGAAALTWWIVKG